MKSQLDITEEKKKLEVFGKAAVPHFYQRLIKEVHDLNLALEKPLCNEDCKKQIIQLLRSKEAYFDPLKIVEKEKEKFDIEDSIAECTAAIAFNNVTAKDTQQIQQEWPKLIERLSNNTSLGFSFHSKNVLLDKIKNDLSVHFNVSPLEKKVSPFTNITDGTPLEKKPSLSKAYSYLTNETQFKNAAKVPRCSGIQKVASLNDKIIYSTSSNTGELIVFPFSCEHTHIGKEIMAHELGHAVSYMMGLTPEMSVESKYHYKALRECSDQNTPSGLLSIGNEKWTTEEDTADLFSYALSEDKENFMGCALVLPDGKEFQRLKMKKKFADPHSSSISRLMMELQYKNPAKISEACTEVIKRSKSLVKQKCF